MTVLAHRSGQKAHHGGKGRRWVTSSWWSFSILLHLMEDRKKTGPGDKTSTFYIKGLISSFFHKNFVKFLKFPKEVQSTLDNVFKHSCLSVLHIVTRTTWMRQMLKDESISWNVNQSVKQTTPLQVKDFNFYYDCFFSIRIMNNWIISTFKTKLLAYRG